MQTFLIFLVAIFGYAEYFLFGRAQTYRPIVMCAVTGLVLGDLSQGVIIRAQMELAFIGVQEIGLSTPQDMVSASIIGTSIAIQSGGNFSTAITFGLPVSMLVLLVQNLVYILISPLFVKKCEEIAAQGRTRTFSRFSFWGGTLLHFGPSIVLVTLTFVLGNVFAKTVVGMIPNFIQDGLVVASGILPAVGFAMLLEVIMKKDVLPFFFIGFLLVAYLKIPIIGIALLGVSLIAFMYFYDEKHAAKAQPEGGDDNEF
ncbi:PTS sugar transporter subunit IIC [Pediococcus acidilactici]|mgnify:CR=1 FL=1|uniref:PTS mannose/fructose/sorbose/N-acetylgalactosamine transporter subunit IIC n=1 Tax=Pediococcus acidilactici TaxID=1254 RepID=UPI000326F084|nr:PTS sugar transporter subunit IIC [Pediococcus acidilactici]EOA08311.1 PTS system, mannose/fructose/sorbose family, IIC component [Pediococcus acidilactici D3]MBW4797806.1 PTS sugar transporter subunit IIC [Pediococcus acidilactici]MBW9307248.1 PTS sugar transporter subunit IIC [Pediococcus acidilactici]MCE5962810.1 PTS sugar transporter subunit IIC [Pediococcus acidilactici]MCW8083845.1 PTS sugar transporter subunit IIC [Pediococcus acidilactici]